MSIYTSTLDKTEDERLAERSRLRLAIAERELKVRRMRELQDQLAAIDREADAAADQHQATTAPIQSQLAEITRQQAADLVAKKTESKTLEARRRELLGELQEANTKLEEAIDKSKQAKKYLTPELKEITSEVTAGAALEGQLRHTAPLDDQCRSWAASRGVKFAHERLAVAEQNYRTAADELRQAEAEPRNYDLVQFHRRAGQWSAELASAGRMLEAARQEHTDCEQRLTED